MNSQLDFIFDPSLVLYLPLGELDGAKFMSRDAYGHLCTVTGATWSPNGRVFAGAENISVANVASLNITGTVTIEAWLYLTAGQATSRTIVAKTGGSPYYFYCLRIIASKLACQIRVDGTNNIADANANYTATTWTHVLGLYNGANVILYINTVAQADQPADTGAMETGTGILSIGSWQTTEYFEGTIGEVRIYNRSLTPLEIKHNYLATKGRYR